LIARKRDVFAFYAREMANLDVAMNPERPGSVNGFWMPTVVFAPHLKVSRDLLLQDMQREEIDGRVFFWPLSMLPPFQNSGAQTPIAHDVSPRALNLPSYHDITDSDLRRVVAVVSRHCTRIA